MGDRCDSLSSDQSLTSVFSEMAEDFCNWWAPKPKISIEVDPEDLSLRESLVEVRKESTTSLTLSGTAKSITNTLWNTIRTRVKHHHVKKVRRKPISNVGRRPVRLMEVVVLRNSGMMERMSRDEL